MSYIGTDYNRAKMLASDISSYTLSAGATETAHSLSITPFPQADGEGVDIEVAAVAAGNANAKEVRVSLENGFFSDIHIYNQTTTAPNGVHIIVKLRIYRIDATNVSYRGEVIIDGVATEVYVGTVTNTFTTGTPIIKCTITGVAASDITTYGLSVKAYEL